MPVYRLLNVGNIIKPTDEYWTGYKWLSCKEGLCNVAKRKRVSEYDVPIRRTMTSLHRKK